MQHLIIDGTNLLLRSHATTGRELTFPDGAPSGAAFGLVRTVLAAARDISRRHGPLEGVHVAWDGGRSQRRLALLPDYKGARDRRRDATQTPEQQQAIRAALRRQREVATELLAFLGVAHYRADGVEGDDIAAALALSLGAEAVVLSADGDFDQLLDPEGHGPARAYPSQRGEVLEGDGPGKLATAVIRGDDSDSIPGLRGVGAQWSRRIGRWFRDKFGVWNVETLLRWYRGELGEASCDEKPLATKIAQLRESEAIVERNRRLMDLRIPLGWPEVLAAVEHAPDPLAGNAETFRRACLRIGFNSIAAAPEANKLAEMLQ